MIEPMQVLPCALGTPTERAAAFIAIAKSMCGLSAHGESRGQYLDLIAPGEYTRMRKAMAVMSGCALVVRAALRMYGLTDPELKAPYIIGSAMSSLMAIADRHNCKLPSSADPEPADVVIIGTDPPTADYGGPGHALIVDFIADGFLHSIDGGQIDEHGAQCVRAVTRPIHRIGRATWLRSRRIYAVLRFTLRISTTG